MRYHLVPWQSIADIKIVMVTIKVNQWSDTRAWNVSVTPSLIIVRNTDRGDI